MASLQVTISESVTLNNQPIEATHTDTISGVNDVFRRIITCTASQTTPLVVFNDTVHGATGAIDIQDTKYIRITNIDSSNSIRVTVIGTDHATFVLSAGKSFILGQASNGFFARHNDDSVDYGETYHNLASIEINNGNASTVQVELFIAS